VGTAVPTKSSALGAQRFTGSGVDTVDRGHRGWGMLAPLNLLPEVIDYHQHLYSPDAGNLIAQLGCG